MKKEITTSLILNALANHRKTTVKGLIILLNSKPFATIRLLTKLRSSGDIVIYYSDSYKTKIIKLKKEELYIQSSILD